MKKILNAKWYDYLFNFVCLVILVTIGVVFKSSPLIITVNVISIIMMLFITKGSFVGTILQIFNAAFYAFISFQSAYYGEVICSVLITIPLTIFSAITWIKNRRKGSAIIKVNKIKLKEWVIVLFSSLLTFVGVFFLLRAFNTANLVVSSVSLTLGIYANYLLMRRCEYNFVIYIINNLVCITLWMFLVVSDISYLPLVINYFMLLIYNTIGLINWLKLKKEVKNKKGEIYE